MAHHPTTHADGALANVLAGHVEAVYAQEDAPAVLNAPARHAAQDAGAAAYVPAGHVEAVNAQEEAPAGL